jgi:lipid-binding SYLF domain-containing protein
MKKVFILLAVCASCAALAVDKPHLEQKAQLLVAKFEKMQEKPQKRVPPDVLTKARGIILLDRTKAGFIFAYQGGGGIAMVKDSKGNWGPLAFMKADEASLGFQIGGQQSFFAILLMNEESVKTLVADSTFEFGGEARGTAGDTSAGAEGTVKSVESAVLVYDEREGLFGGAAVKGGAIAPDREANLVYYEKPVTMKEILFQHKVKASETASTLGQKLDRYSKKES